MLLLVFIERRFGRALEAVHRPVHSPLVFSLAFSLVPSFGVTASAYFLFLGMSVRTCNPS